MEKNLQKINVFLNLKKNLLLLLLFKDNTMYHIIIIILFKISYFLNFQVTYFDNKTNSNSYVPITLFNCF